MWEEALVNELVKHFDNHFNASFFSFPHVTKKTFSDCSYGGELARLGGLARLGEIIFIPRSYGIFYLSSIKKFCYVAGKRLFDQVVFTIKWRKSIMQNKYSYIINFWKAKQNWLKKILSHLAGRAHLRVFTLAVHAAYCLRIIYFSRTQNFV